MEIFNIMEPFQVPKQFNEHVHSFRGYLFKLVFNSFVCLVLYFYFLAKLCQ